MRVSIICTVKNAEETIEETLQSLRNQTFENWELVVVDDGSTDSTPCILKRYSHIDARIKPIFTNGVGRGKALNIALYHAEYNYVANIDGDDLSHPRRLEIQIKALQKHKNFAVVGTRCYILSGKGPIKWPLIEEDEIFIIDITDRLVFYNPICHSSVLMKKEAVLAVNGYSEQRKFQFDYDLWVRLAHAGFRLGVIPLPLTIKRIHKGQHFERGSRIRYLISSAQVQLKAIRFLGGGLSSWFSLVLRIGWGLLPSKIRLIVYSLNKIRGAP